jgi:pilus assembly protein Flp/PilA
MESGMRRSVRSIRHFVDQEDGVTAIEYALIAALIAVVIIGGATAIGLNVNAVLNTVAGTIANA